MNLWEENKVFSISVGQRGELRSPIVFSTSCASHFSFNIYFWPRVVCFIHHLWKHLLSKYLILYQEWSNRKKHSVSFVCRKALLGGGSSSTKWPWEHAAPCLGESIPSSNPQVLRNKSLVRICMLILFNCSIHFWICQF